MPTKKSENHSDLAPDVLCPRLDAKSKCDKLKYYGNTLIVSNYNEISKNVRIII